MEKIAAQGHSAKAWLGLGGNLGQAEAHFRYAVTRLRQASCKIITVSALYQSPAWGKENQPDFINACLLLETKLPPKELLHLCLSIERERGRIRAEKWGPRSLDIDILLYENYQSPPADKELILPHPFLSERAFVILPLAEISPQLQLSGETLASRAAAMRQSGAAAGIKTLKPAALWAQGLTG